MAKNSLTTEQDLLVRVFWDKVCQDPNVLPSEPVSIRRLRRLVLDLLNYDVLPNGAYVQRGSKVKTKLGETSFADYPCQWKADTERALAAQAAEKRTQRGADEEVTDNDQDTDKASSSEQAESS